MKFVSLSSITTGLQAVATILSAVRVITASVRSLATVQNSDNSSEQKHKGFHLGIHKWIFIAGAIVGLVTIAYLENIILNLKPRQKVSVKPTQERFETVYVNG